MAKKEENVTYKEEIENIVKEFKRTKDISVLQRMLQIVSDLDESSLKEAEKYYDKLVNDCYKFKKGKYYYINIKNDDTDAIYFLVDYEADVYMFDTKEELEQFIKNGKKTYKQKETKTINIPTKKNSNVSYFVTKNNETFELAHKDIYSLNTVINYDDLLNFPGTENSIDRNSISYIVFYPSMRTYTCEHEDCVMNYLYEMYSGYDKYEDWGLSFKYYGHHFEHLQYIGVCNLSADELFQEEKSFFVITTYPIGGLISEKQALVDLDYERKMNLKKLKENLASKEDKEAFVLAKEILNELGITDENGNLLPRYSELTKAEQVNKKTRKTAKKSKTT